MDALTFLIAFNHYGITGELNPVAVWLYGMGGLALVLIPKAVGVLLVSAGLIWLRGRNQELAITGALAMALVGFVGWALNSLALLV